MEARRHRGCGAGWAGGREHGGGLRLDGHEQRIGVDVADRLTGAGDRLPSVPTPATGTSTRPSSASRISGPERWWTSGFAGFENWSSGVVGLLGQRTPPPPPRSSRPYDDLYAPP